MSKIPTAEEWLQMSPISHYYDDKTDKMVCFADDVKYAMIEFTKLHVQAALDAAYKNAHRYYDPAEGEYDVDRDSIITAYPLENIK